MAREVNAKGLNCPQPLYLASVALSEEPGPVTVAVDTQSAVESLNRAAKREKRSLEIVKSGDETVFKFGPRQG